MEEAEELLAPLKLIIRIVRRSRTQPPTVISKESASILRKFLGWDGFSFVFFTGLAFGFLQLPFQYDKARWCFIAAAVALVIKIVHSVDAGIYAKLLITILGSVLAGLGASRINDWVTRLQIEALANEAPAIRIITTEKLVSPPPPPPARTYLAFDGPMRFPAQRYVSGQLAPFDNFRVGDTLSFDYYLKVIGPNSIETDGSARWLYLEPDSELETQQHLIEDFKSQVKKERKEHPVKVVPKTVMPGPAGWSTLFAIDEDKQHHVLTADDLKRFSDGTKVVFAILELSYKDQGKVHHLRTCQFLQPPAIPPGIWHFCEAGFTKSD